MPKLPEDVAAEAILECVKAFERHAKAGEGVWSCADWAAGFLRNNRTTIIASVTKPGG